MLMPRGKALCTRAGRGHFAELLLKWEHFAHVKKSILPVVFPWRAHRYARSQESTSLTLCLYAVLQYVCDQEILSCTTWGVRTKTLF